MKHVLLRAQVMIEHDGQPYELEVTGADGTKHRVQPAAKDIVSPLDLTGISAWDDESPRTYTGNYLGLSRGPVAPPREEVRARLDEAKWWNETRGDQIHTTGELHRERLAQLEAVLAATPTLRVERCQAKHPEGGQCELKLGHEFSSHLAGMILWNVQP